MAIAFHFAARSDVGMVRTNNEDSGYAGPHLLAMADGMGGHAGGDVASSAILGALVGLDGESFSGVDATRTLLRRITAANTELGQLAHDDPDLDGMGTTLIAILRARDKLVLAHIGDSRAYVVRGGEVSQITKDHSFVQSLVDEGRLTPEEASTHPQRSLVTRVLTGAEGEEPDVVVRQAIVGDRYLICSDGLSDYVARDTIDEILTTERKPGDCAERLVQLALRAGAPDNVTVVIGDVVDMTQFVPSDSPQIVGAAAAIRRHTRPIPVTPAAKAAALSHEASGGSADDDIELADEGSRSRTTTILRTLGVALVAAILLVGGGYAAYSWSQAQFYVGVNDGRVAVFKGVDQTLGPLDLSQAETTSGIDVDDLPDFYRGQLDRGITMETRSDAAALVRNLEVQAQACRYAKSLGRSCATVPSTWTTPTPTPTPSGSPTVSPTGPLPTGTPGVTPSGSPSPTISPNA
ncbi:putative magnesium or manganese-dependent protein phosphatase [Janibacter sp. HTCC2649]|uniref:PP2C family protein-serine/threonine phosphatase n=1 Tax=Janibacter sp. HTCC2649 TaxID=313589 RepID=UPI0000671A5A|nr:PP2C family serine/threonine-protein phosphatase [Janibacter sp. HTCC2649]EAP97921.1 putative magnesium or manganese-dependent protein phosphatase [Janibacter sp. HTCC2649]